MCDKLFKIISKHDIKDHFCSTPGAGFQDFIFTFKTLLPLRHNYNLPTWVAFCRPFKGPSHLQSCTDNSFIETILDHQMNVQC